MTSRRFDMAGNRGQVANADATPKSSIDLAMLRPVSIGSALQACFGAAGSRKIDRGFEER